MKKILILCVLLTTIHVKAQKSFEKKTNVISVGGDLGIYDYASRIGSTGQSESNKAANKMLNLHYERGILNWLGIGAQFLVSDYFTSTDSITNTKPSVKAVDGTAFVNIHFIRTKRVDLLAGVNVGYSSLNWEARDQNVSSAKGGGPVVEFHLKPRFYFGKHVGMSFNLGYVNYNYQNMDFKNTQTQIADILDLKGGGVNFGLGLQVKF